LLARLESLFGTLSLENPDNDVAKPLPAMENIDPKTDCAVDSESAVQPACVAVDSMESAVAVNGISIEMTAVDSSSHLNDAKCLDSKDVMEASMSNAVAQSTFSPLSDVSHRRLQ
jgi:hypothetical protein